MRSSPSSIVVLILRLRIRRLVVGRVVVVVGHVSRRLGAAARADLAGAESKRDDVTDLLSRAGDLVACAAQDRGSVEPSTDVPDYDDDSANDEPTDSSSEDDR